MEKETEYTLGEIAAVTGFSPSLLSRRFRKLNHIGIVERCGRQKWKLGEKAMRFREEIGHE